MRAMPDPRLDSVIAGPPGLEGARLLHPLDAFYRRSGVALPLVEQVRSPEIPEPYRSLLVHESDMTPTLKKFHGQNIHIRVLSHRWEDHAYFREVVLLLDGDEKPVEFGAIKINLELFAPDARREILCERRPLGDIMQSESVQHTSRPKAFLRLHSDSLMNRALQLEEPAWLYGRRNTLFNPGGEPLAEIIEILPP